MKINKKGSQGGALIMIALIAIIGFILFSLFGAQTPVSKDFEIIDIEAQTTASLDDAIHVKVTVRNIGDEIGKTNLEVGIYSKETSYIKGFEGFAMTWKQMTACAKQNEPCKSNPKCEFFVTTKESDKIKPGETVTVEFAVNTPTEESILGNGDSNYNENNEYVVLAGTYMECGDAHSSKVMEDIEIK